MATTLEKPLFKDGKITRAGMEDAIRRGGSVQLEDGRTITKIEELPSEAELAKGNPAAEKQVVSDLQKQITEAQKQLKEMQASQAATATQIEAQAAAIAAAQGTGTPPAA